MGEGIKDVYFGLVKVAKKKILLVACSTFGFSWA